MPPFGGLGVMYDVRVRFIGKHLVDFLLVLTELFSLGVMLEALQANIDWKSIKLIFAVLCVMNDGPYMLL